MDVQRASRPDQSATKRFDKAMEWVNDSGYEIYKQSHVQSCGLACTAMVCNLLGLGKPTERTILNLMGSDWRKRYDAATQDKLSGATTTVLSAVAHARGEIHWGSGTNRDWVLHALDVHGVDTSTSGSTVSAMRSVSASTPVIVGVRWDGGGGHWVLVVGRQKNGLGASSTYTILDPSGDAVLNTGSQVYTAASGAKGRFAADFITCSKRA